MYKRQLLVYFVTAKHLHLSRYVKLQGKQPPTTHITGSLSGTLTNWNNRGPVTPTWLCNVATWCKGEEMKGKAVLSIIDQATKTVQDYVFG